MLTRPTAPYHSNLLPFFEELLQDEQILLTKPTGIFWKLSNKISLPDFAPLAFALFLNLLIWVKRHTLDKSFPVWAQIFKPGEENDDIACRNQSLRKWQEEDQEQICRPSHQPVSSAEAAEVWDQDGKKLPKSDRNPFLPKRCAWEKQSLDGWLPQLFHLRTYLTKPRT